MRWHLHRDPDWSIHGANAYYRCARCGAGRTVRLTVTEVEPQ